MAKEIICLHGEAILVDDEDYPLLVRHRWRYRDNGKKCYAATQMNVGGEKSWRTIFMHNMILGFAFQVDHVDGDTKNNQKSNLRPATYQENGWNKGKPKRSRYGEPASQFKGVHREVQKDASVRWRVVIKLTGKGVRPAKYLRLGPFDDEVEAARVYNAEIVKLRGEWAWVNPLPGEAA